MRIAIALAVIAGLIIPAAAIVLPPETGSLIQVQDKDKDKDKGKKKAVKKQTKKDKKDGPSGPTAPKAAPKEKGGY